MANLSKTNQIKLCFTKRFTKRFKGKIILVFIFLVAMEERVQSIPSGTGLSGVSTEPQNPSNHPDGLSKSSPPFCGQKLPNGLLTGGD